MNHFLLRPGACVSINSGISSEGLCSSSLLLLGMPVAAGSQKFSSVHTYGFGSATGFDTNIAEKFK